MTVYVNAPSQIACKCGRDTLLFCVIKDGTEVVVVCPDCTKPVAAFTALGHVLN